MKHTLMALAGALIFSACEKSGDHIPGKQQTPISNAHHLPGNTMARYSAEDYTKPISVDTANRMIQSYLNGIGYPSNEIALRSLLVDADTLRAYLSDSKITTIKLMLAHKPSYLNAGNYGRDAGLSAEALTLVLVGMDEEDNYVYNAQGCVYDYMYGCPTNCPNADVILQ